MRCLILMAVLVHFGMGSSLAMAQTREQPIVVNVQETEDEMSSGILEFLGNIPNVQELDQSLEKGTEGGCDTFAGIMQEVIEQKGVDGLGQKKAWILGAVFQEIDRKKELVLKLFILTAAFALLRHFTDLFQESQVSEAGYYVTFLAMTLLLVRSFTELDQIVVKATKDLELFVKMLMPVFAAALTCTGGNCMSAVYGEGTLLVIYLVEMGMSAILLPMIHGYFVMGILNYMTRQEMLSGLQELTERVILWGLRSMAILVCGIGFVQNMMAPVLDRMKMMKGQRLASLVPGLGNIGVSVIQLVYGSGTVIRHAVGVTGILCIVGICMVPACKLLVSCLLYKVAQIFVEMLADKRIAGVLRQTARASELYLKYMFTMFGMFLTTLAITVAAGSLME